MLNVVITGGCSSLGGAIVDILQRTDVLLTVIGRQSTSNKRANDCFVELDLSDDKSGWKYNNFKFVSKVLFISNAGIIDPGVLNTTMQQKIRNSESRLFPEECIFSNLTTNGGLLEPQVTAQKIINKMIGP